ncbi:hypothetical protein MRX96_047384 [Rhipicephalus microplus]
MCLTPSSTWKAATTSPTPLVGASRLTSTFGLTLASQLCSLFGMDVWAQAVYYANFNALVNGSQRHESRCRTQTAIPSNTSR